MSVVTVKRVDVTRIINEDPWSLVLTHYTGSTETQSTLAGRVFPATGRAYVSAMTSAQLRGETPLASVQWLALVAWDAADFATGDRVKATHTESGITHTFDVVMQNKYPYKKEILLDERK
ncbi:MAG: hypothetical protein PHV11_07470 [Candidatus Bipolaricaulis sp.]|jgi:hypothetical protein|nr:hypothetical protein [Candidatus Bipolaricaulis sp.]